MEPNRDCGRAPSCGLDYQGKLSSPLLDCIDLAIDVPSVSAADLALPPPAESSADVAARVVAARTVQLERLAALDRKGKLLSVEADHTAGLLAERARSWQKPRCNADTDGALLAAIAECRGPRAAHAGGRAVRPLGPRLASHLAGRAHAGRSRRLRLGASPAHCRGALLPAHRAAHRDGGLRSRVGAPRPGTTAC
jgi:Magnesium chelatase, subunit ChlI